MMVFYRLKSKGWSQCSGNSNHTYIYIYINPIYKIYIYNIYIYIYSIYRYLYIIENYIINIFFSYSRVWLPQTTPQKNERTKDFNTIALFLAMYALDRQN